ncbi:MAG: hypothetical protein Q4A52_05615 [Bacillota bacterium]|nr:hypothetical protein [Bacillota bacterium]
MKKRIFALLLVLVLLSNTLSFAAFRAYIRVVADEKIQVVQSGERSDYFLKIKNTGIYMAQNLKVEIQGAHPFRADVSTLFQDIRYISPNQTETIKFNVMPSPLAQTKIYEFDVVFSYKDSEDNVVTNTEKAYVKVENNKQAPSLSVVFHETNTKETVKGTPNSLNLDVRNNGDAVANDIRVTLSGMTNTGVILHNETDVKRVGEIAGGAKTRVNYLIIAGPDAKSGTQTLNVLLEWTDDLGNQYKKEQQVYVVVAGGAGAVQQGDLEIKVLSAPKALVKEQDFQIKYQITNRSTSKIEQMEIQFEHPEGIIAKSNSRMIVRNLEPGASREIVVDALTKKEVQPETYHCYIVANLVNYETEARTQIAREYVGLYIESTDDEGSKPKLIIADYQYGGMAMAGEEFDLEFTIRNTSNSESTRNIKVTLAGEDSAFTPVDSSNSLFIPSIGPGQEVTRSIRYSTKIDAAVKIYTVNVKMEYEDGKGKAYDAKGNPYMEQESISINVAQPIRLETSPIQIPDVIFAGEPFYIEQEYYNMGKSTMFNLIIKIEGVNSRSPQSFVGNFEAGRSDYFSVQAYADEPGTHDGKLVFRFEDALGKQSEIEKTFTYTVSEMVPGPDGMGPDGKPNGGFEPIDPGMMPDVPVEGGLNWPLIIGGGVVALIVIVLIVRSIRKKRAAKLEELDD